MFEAQMAKKNMKVCSEQEVSTLDHVVSTHEDSRQSKNEGVDT